MSSFVGLDQFFGGGLGLIIGDPFLAGLLLLLVLVGLVIMLRLSFDAVLVNVAFPLWAASLPVALGGTGFLPEWVVGLMAMSSAAFLYLAYLRLFNR